MCVGCGLLGAANLKRTSSETQAKIKRKSSETGQLGAGRLPRRHTLLPWGGEQLGCWLRHLLCARVCTGGSRLGCAPARHCHAAAGAAKRPSARRPARGALVLVPLAAALGADTTSVPCLPTAWPAGSACAPPGSPRVHWRVHACSGRTRGHEARGAGRPQRLAHCRRAQPHLGWHPVAPGADARLYWFQP